MTTEEVLTHEMIQINTLYGLEDVKDCYYLKGYDVINIETNKVKIVSIHNCKRHYPYITFSRKYDHRNKKVFMHHIIALAYIHNGPFEVIEHLNDDQNDYSVENLFPSTQAENVRRAFRNGRSNRIDKTYSVIMNDGSEHKGTMKELSVELNIPR